MYCSFEIYIDIIILSKEKCNIERFSFMLFLGDESLSLLLRELVAKELHRDNQMYLSDLQEVIDPLVGKDVSRQLIFHTLVAADTMASCGQDTEAAWVEECKRTFMRGQWSGIQHVAVLASVLGREIYSLFPDVPYVFRALYNKVYKPCRVMSPTIQAKLECTFKKNSTPIPLAILWSQIVYLSQIIYSAGSAVFI